MAPQTYTEATLPPALRIPFDQWSDIAAQERDLDVPPEHVPFRAGVEIVNGYIAFPEAINLGRYQFWGGYLYYAERVGQDIIVAQASRGCEVLLIRKGIIRRLAAIQMPKSFRLESNAWFVWSRLSAVRTAELAVLTLRERQKRPGRRPKSEAWLRRQLEGLGGLTPVAPLLFSPKHTSAYERVWTLVDELMERNKGTLTLDPARHASLAGIGLLAKARKSAGAILRLSRGGYGEDALILARSLVNLTIDLAYITSDTALTDTRARLWFARGVVARHDFLTMLGEPDPLTCGDWEAERALAKTWKDQGIELRAKACGLENFYRLPYRHGSVFEHSDSWSAVDFIDEAHDGSGLHLRGVSSRYVDLALLSGACCMGTVASSVAALFGFAFEREAEGVALITEAFGEAPPERTKGANTNG